MESRCIQLSGLAYFWRATASWTFLVSNDLDISEEYWVGLFLKCASIGTVFVFFFNVRLGLQVWGRKPTGKGSFSPRRVEVDTASTACHCGRSP